MLMFMGTMNISAQLKSNTSHLPANTSRKLEILNAPGNVTERRRGGKTFLMVSFPGARLLFYIRTIQMDRYFLFLIFIISNSISINIKIRV